MNTTTKNFVQKCIDGEESPNNYKLYLKEWASTHPAISLPGYLGFSHVEHAYIVYGRKTVEQVIEEKRNALQSKS